MIPVIVVCLGAAISYIVSRQIYEAYRGEITTFALAGYLAFMSLFFPIVLIIAVSVGARGLLFVAFNCLVWFPTVMVFRNIVTEYSAHIALGNMFFPPIDKPVKNRLGKVRTALWDEDPKNAMKACLEELDKYPGDGGILLDSAVMFQEKGHYEEALYLYEKAVKVFPTNAEVWPVAMYHAATLYLERLDNREKASEMFCKLAEAFPDKEIGMRSRERIHEQWYPSLHPETDPLFHKTPQRLETEKDGREAMPPDPFYRKRPEERRQKDEAAPPQLSCLGEEMRDLFLDDAPSASPSSPYTRLAEEMPELFTDDT